MALKDVLLAMCAQCCGFHKMGKALNAPATSQYARANSAFPEIGMAATRQEDTLAFDWFVVGYGARYSKAVEKLTTNCRILITFYHIPSRALGASAHHQSDRVDFFHCAPVRGPHVQLGLAGDVFCIDIQTDRVRQIQVSEKMALLLRKVTFKYGNAVQANTPSQQNLAALSLCDALGVLYTRIDVSPATLRCFWIQRYCAGQGWHHARCSDLGASHRGALHF